MHNEIARLLSQSATIASLILAAGGVAVLLGRKAQGRDRKADDEVVSSGGTINEQQQWIVGAVLERRRSVVDTAAHSTDERWPGGLEAWRADRDRIIRELCMEVTEMGVTAAVEALLDPVLGERIEGARRAREEARSN